MQSVTEAHGFANITASQQLSNIGGKLLGIFVASVAGTPTIKVWDSDSASGTVIVNTFTPMAGQFYPMPAAFGEGLYVTIGGTVDCTVFFNAGQ